MHPLSPFTPFFEVGAMQAVERTEVKYPSRQHYPPLFVWVDDDDDAPLQSAQIRSFSSV